MASEAKTEEKSTVPAKIEKGGFVALNIKPGELQEAFQANLGDEGISPLDLQRIKIPTGGSLSWEVPTLEGTEAAKTVEGVIVAWQDCKGYWGKDFAGGEPPLCQSLDGKIGTGLRWEGDSLTGHLCNECALSRWGSKIVNGVATKGQACKSMRRLYVLQENDLLPKLLTLPPTSLKVCRSFFLGLAGHQVRFSDRVITIGLAERMNAAGIKYAVATFALGRELSRSEQTRVREYEKMLAPMFLMSVEADGAAVEAAPTIPTPTEEPPKA